MQDDPSTPFSEGYLLMVANPNSGQGMGMRTAGYVAHKLRGCGYRVRTLFTRKSLLAGRSSRPSRSWRSGRTHGTSLAFAKLFPLSVSA